MEGSTWVVLDDSADGRLCPLSHLFETSGEVSKVWAYFCQSSELLMGRFMRNKLTCSSELLL